MIQVQEMVQGEIEGILQRIGYGHFACARNNQPYVVPIHYAYEKPDIYIYTTEGMKTEIINSNPHVCLQVEDVVSNTDWRSVVVYGDAERIDDPDEREKVLRLILQTNPTLTPAISIKWLDNRIRENHEIVYRIKPRMLTGRYSVIVKRSAAFAQPGPMRKSQLF